MKKYFPRLFVLFAGAFLWWSIGCSGSATAPTLEGNLLDYQELELVNFSVSGEAVCAACSAGDFVGLQLDLYLKADPTRDLAVEMFDGLGHFKISNLRTHKDATVVAQGRLYWNDSVDTPPLIARAEFKTPGSDGETVTFTLEFSAAQSD